MMLLVSWQGTLTGAHIDLPPSGAHAVASASIHPHPSRNGHDPATCPICWAAATAGHFLLPTPIRAVFVARVPLWSAEPIATEGAQSSHSHGWRSRAPPQT